MKAISVRPAQDGDAASIARLFHENFRSEVAQLFIYGSSGAAVYIRMQLACPSCESAYFVAHTVDAVIGAAEFRRQPGGLLLNYIAVNTDHRHLAVGSTLLLSAIHMMGFSSGLIRLDVLEDNDAALRWYKKLGFIPTGSSEFLEITRTTAATVSTAYVSGLPQADVCHERFGFSSFNLITASGPLSVGRMGDAWFRISDAAAIGMSEVYAALNKLDPERRLFAILPASGRPIPGAKLIARTLRMQTEIEQLLRVLPCQ